MPFPIAVDEQIRRRFDELISRAEKLLRGQTPRKQMASFEGESHIAFEALQENAITLIILLFNESKRGLELKQQVSRHASTTLGTEALLGKLRALKDDYQAGMLESLANMMEANIAADYMGQAEQLLKEGSTGQYDHVPAAVLTGAVLEDALRRLCQRQTPPIDLVITDAKGRTSPKMLNLLIDDLKKAGLYNELKAKQLRAWVDIRNAAAHGEFAKFKPADVESLIAGVKTFIADYL